MGSKYYACPASTEEDVGQAITLWERNLGVQWGREKYRWFYQTNPFRPGTLLLLKLAGTEEAVGVGGIGYRRFQVRGKTLVGAMGVDFAVDREHRSLGPALKLQRAIMETAQQEADFIYGYPNERSQAILKHFGYHQIAAYARLVKVLRSERFLRKEIKPAFGAKLLSIPADLWLRFKLVKAHPGYGQKRFLDGSEPDQAQLDQLWTRLCERGLLMGDRSASYLKWRYLECPNIAYQIYAFLNEEGTMEGCLVYFLREKQFHLVDLLWPDLEKRKELQALLGSFERHCLQASAHSITISTFGHKEMYEQLLAMGYQFREYSRTVWVYTEDRDLLAQFQDLENSLWFLGDEDNN